MRTVDEAAKAILEIAARGQAAEAEPAPEQTKLCSVCGPTEGPKPLSKFDRHPTLADGRDTRCKACKVAKAKELRHQRKKAAKMRAAKKGKAMPEKPEDSPEVKTTAQIAFEGLKSLLGQLYAVEVLEYENASLLAGDYKSRNEAKQELLWRARAIVENQL